MRRADVLLLVGLTLACLLPFLDKPLHIDDPVYVRIAQQIVEDPADFFGFEMNWHNQLEPVTEFNKNPPGVSFYLALAGLTLGWGERSLHAAMLLPAIALVLGVHALGRRFGANSRAAGLMMVTLPVFLVSATTLMADVSMLALWCWSMVLFSDGVVRGSRVHLLGGGLLAGLCVLTKYSGIALIPLLALCGLVQRERGWAWLVYLLVPVVMVAAFDAYMRNRYGVSPFGEVGAYALSYRSQLSLGERGLVGLSFLGGCLLTGLFAAPLLWSRAGLAAGLTLMGAGLLIAPFLGSLGPLVLLGEGGVEWLAVAQFVLFVACGFQWLLLAALDLQQRRDAASWILAAWLLGVFVFATFVNWSVNARALLPAAPAAILLLTRRIELRWGGGAMDSRPFLLAPVVPALLVALAVAWADARLAESARTAASFLVERHSRSDRQIWFRGAWGFQHYAMAAGAQKIDETDTLLQKGWIVLLPVTNSNVYPIPPEDATALERVDFPGAGWIVTMSMPFGAGFYSDIWGPLPYAIGDIPPERYFVLRLERPLTIRRQKPD